MPAHHIVSVVVHAVFVDSLQLSRMIHTVTNVVSELFSAQYEYHIHLAFLPSSLWSNTVSFVQQTLSDFTSSLFKTPQQVSRMIYTITNVVSKLSSAYCRKNTHWAHLPSSLLSSLPRSSSQPEAALSTPLHNRSRMTRTITT